MIRAMAPDPVTATERLNVVDALRGFALAGVLLINLGTLTQYDFLTEKAKRGLATARFDVAVEPGLRFLADGKAITLFTMLFGFGFALQMERADQTGRACGGLFLRRMGVLLLIGLAHGELLWWGDILRFYAVLGVALLLAQRLPDRVLLWSGLVLSLLLPPLLTPWATAALASRPDDAAMAAVAAKAFASASYREMVQGNLAYDWWALFAFWSLPFSVFGRFLLGYWAGRKGLLQDPAAHLPLWRRLVGAGLVAGLVGTTFTTLSAPLNVAAMWPWLDSAPGETVTAFVGRVGTLGLGISYAAGFVLLHQRPAWRARLDLLAPVGRMALTNYLVQTFASIIVFYGIGLGLGPRTGLAGWLGFAVVLFALQVRFSQWWLRHFHYGPAEWLWRSLACFRPQPFRREGVRAEYVR